jgi:hypothetical protein
MLKGWNWVTTRARERIRGGAGARLRARDRCHWGCRLGLGLSHSRRGEGAHDRRLARFRKRRRRSALMAEGGPSSKRPARASARLVAAAESALPPLLRALTGDPLRAVAKLLPDAALTCFRLVCRAFRDHSSPAPKKCRGDFLRTRALVVFAWLRMPGFVTALPYMLRFAAYVGCVGVLEELVDIRQCALAADACAAAAEGGAPRCAGLAPLSQLPVGP